VTGRSLARSRESSSPLVVPAGCRSPPTLCTSPSRSALAAVPFGDGARLTLDSLYNSVP
jgi:hypothetical protein